MTKSNPLGSEKIIKVYKDMLDIFYKKFQDYNTAWDHLLEFLAVDNCPPMLLQMDHNFEWLYDDKELAKQLIDVYDLKLLKSYRHDYLGQLYVERQSKSSMKSKGQVLTPEHVAEFIAYSTIVKTDEKINILDPAVGTGRFLMAANKYAPNARVFGVDIDLGAIRVAFVNCAIHNVSARLLHADSLIHETDISKPEGVHNWQFANRWHSCWDELKQMSANDALFSAGSQIQMVL